MPGPCRAGTLTRRARVALRPGSAVGRGKLVLESPGSAAVDHALNCRARTVTVTAAPGVNALLAVDHALHWQGYRDHHDSDA